MGFLKVVLFCSVLLLSCKLDCFPEDANQILIQLPRWDLVQEEYHLPALCGWKIRIGDSDGFDEFVHYSGDLWHEFKRNKAACVLAYPLVKDAYGNFVDFFKPAGALAYDATGGVLELGWENAVSAFVMMRLVELAEGCNCKVNLERFNWRKFNDFLLINYCDGEGEKFYNPWNLDLERIVGYIAGSSFRVSFLQDSNTFWYETDCYRNEIISSFIPENKNIQKNHGIRLKQSEVNLISDYNMEGIIVIRKSEKNLSVRQTSLPIFNKEYE